MPRYIYILYIVIGTFGGLFGQQRSSLSFFSKNVYSVVPAYAGFDKSLSMTLHFRNQWNGLEGGVQYQSANAHLPLYVFNGGVGLQVCRDVSGPLQISTGTVSYNYVRTSSWGTWSLGLVGGMSQVTLNGDDLRTPDGDYSGGVDHKDDNLPIVSSSGVMPRLGLSLFYDNGFFQTGLSVDNLTQSSAQLSDAQYTFESRLQLNWVFLYDYQISDLINLQAHVWLANDLAQTQAQFGVLGTYNNNIYAGLSLRGYDSSSKDAIIFLAGIRINRHFTLFYAYDVLISDLNVLEINNTHEFALNYNLNELIRTGLPPKVIYNPRF